MKSWRNTIKRCILNTTGIAETSIFSYVGKLRHHYIMNILIEVANNAKMRLKHLYGQLCSRIFLKTCPNIALVF